jgi:hypothetical protein
MAAAAVAAAWGCSSDHSALVEPAPSQEQVAFQLMSNGRPVRSLADQVIIARATAKAVARVVADDSTRKFLFDALHHSTVREGKLHLQRFLARRGARIARKIEQVLGSEPGTLDAVLAQMADLEIYLPVRSQREGWPGTPDFLVAGEIGSDDSLRKTGAMVPSYDATGVEHLLSYDHPPEQPVIVITNAESRFGPDGETPMAVRHPALLDAPQPPRLARSPTVCDPSDPDCQGFGGGGGGGGSPGSLPCDNQPGSGWFVCEVHLDQTYEGWLMGDPEFTIAFRYPVTNGYNIIGMLNQDEWPWLDYNVAGSTISGSWYFGDQWQVSQALAYTTPTIEVWEDDYGPKWELNKYDFLNSENWGVTEVLKAPSVIGSILFCGGGVKQGLPQYWMVGCPFYAWVVASKTGYTEDDFVGRGTWSANVGAGAPIRITSSNPQPFGAYSTVDHGYIRIRSGTL